MDNRIKKVVRVFGDEGMCKIDFEKGVSDTTIEKWCKVRGLEIFNITIEIEGNG